MSEPVPINICGPSYLLTNPYAGVEDCVNWYPVMNESPDEEAFKITLEESPGTIPFSAVPNYSEVLGPGQGMCEYRGIVYGVSFVAGISVFWSMVAPATLGERTFTLSGWVSGGPVRMVPTGTGQIAIFSSNYTYGWVYTIATSTMTLLSRVVGFLGATDGTFQDGYVLTVLSGTQQMQISGNPTTPVGDATLWTASNVAELVGQQDYTSAIISSREYVRIMGQRRSQVFYNAGAQGYGGFPFQSYNETFIETGIAAPYSLSDLGDSLMWIGQDARGVTAAWRDFAFQPQRASTFAIEQQWQSYSTVADAIAFSWKWKGHLLWQVTFPTAGFTWVYDATMSAALRTPCWHRRTLNFNGTQQRRAEIAHCYCFGLHLVLSDGSDGNPGAVYSYSDCYYDTTQVSGVQVNSPIIPTRVVPRIFSKNNRVKIDRLRLACQQGVGTSSYPNPQALLYVSQDGGNTYPLNYSAPLGAAGAYKTLTEYNRLGISRDWALKITGDGSIVPFNIQGAWANMRELST